MRCRNHPRYLGKRTPKRLCAACWGHWFESEQDRKDEPQDFPRATLEPVRGVRFSFRCAIEAPMDQEEVEIQHMGSPSVEFSSGLLSVTGPVVLEPKGPIQVHECR